VRETSAWHQIVVRDNGRGVVPTEQERIFEMFHSVAYPGGRKGTGIGLAIVKKIAELHGGRAFVESAPGTGAAFHVLLPRS
jgi:signal transduction histidine kinase